MVRFSFFLENLFMPSNHDSKKPKEPISPMKLDISDEMIAERRGGSGPMPKDMPKVDGINYYKN